VSAEGGPPVTYALTPAMANGASTVAVAEVAGPEGAGSVSFHLRHRAEAPPAAGQAAVPLAFALIGTYPNPLTNHATLAFALPGDAEVRLDVSDLLGRRVLHVSEAAVVAGANRSLHLPAARLAAGSYLFRRSARMASETAVETGRFTVIR